MLVEYVLGLGTGLAILSPVEWAVHKHLLHAPKGRRTWYNRATAHAHDDIHHAAYRGPEHYYRDITNAHEIIHFSKGDIGLIVGGWGAAGLIGKKAVEAVMGDPSFQTGDIGMTAGMMTAGFIGYLGYEVSHHYMHVIGARRLAINRAFGDALQLERDGKLRFSKPLLDDICNAVEEYVDAHSDGRGGSIGYDAGLAGRFAVQAAYNRDELKNTLLPVTFDELMQQIAQESLEREQALRASMDAKERRAYWFDRKVQRLFRGSDSLIGRYFRHIDNHHFMHHSNYRKNLNVFLTWADYAFGTKLDSSREALEVPSKKYYLCPNSPDVTPFMR
jgi:hypothetical protein